MLATYPSWKTYCDSFRKAKNPEGSFAVARHYQKMAANTDQKNIRPNTFDTPIALRTRSRRSREVPNISELQLNAPEAPSRNPHGSPETPILSSSDDDGWVADDDDGHDDGDDDDDDDGFPAPSPVTPAAQAPVELQGLMFPPTKEEQIVKTALVIFLNALTIHFDDCQSCNWTIHRKRFIARFAKASFEARTDGYLDDGQENAYALIEVRSKREDLIRMRESAQMVGWLMNDDEKDDTGKLARSYLAKSA